MPWVGTYLFPPRWFGEPGGPSTSEEYHARIRNLSENGTRIIRRFTLEGRKMLVTRMGGIFVEIEPVGEGELDAWTRHGKEAARLVNLFLCDLALRVIVSEVAGYTSLSQATVDEERAVLGAAAGHTNIVRNLDQQRALEENDLRAVALWQSAPEKHLDDAIARPLAPWLEGIHDSLPPLVIAAYSSGHFDIPRAGGIVDSWMVVEQLLNHVWERAYKSRALDKAHRERLGDFRNFTANQRAEVLFAAGVLPGDTYAAVQRARKHRNDLAHSAKLGLKASPECMQAMHKMVLLVWALDEE